jgi:large subunit ribosomal protein L21
MEKQNNKTKKTVKTVEKKTEKKEMPKDFAVIKAAGKQYLVYPGKKIKLNLAPEEKEIKGKKLSFKEVLLVVKGDKIEIGRPTVKGAEVKAEIQGQGKGKKIVVFKYKSKKRYKVKKGHRQSFTEVEITDISLKKA